MIYQCTDCGYSQENEEFNLCPVCIEKEKAELQASAAEANLHIDTLHGAIKELFAKHHLGTTEDFKRAFTTVRQLVDSWEDSQCL